MPSRKTKPAAHGGKRPGAGPKIRDLRLSVAESMLIVDALNGSLIEPEGDVAPEQIIWQDIEDAIRLDKLDAKWHVDGAALVERLRKLDHAAAVKLLSAVDKWWSIEHTKSDRERTRKAGLTK